MIIPDETGVGFGDAGVVVVGGGVWACAVVGTGAVVGGGAG